MGLSISPIYNATLSFTQNVPLHLVNNAVIANPNGTITGSSGVGSSLFLHRINIPGYMNITEVDIPMQIFFNATNDGAGTISRSFVVYSFGNSTSLASVSSASGSSAWTTGTSTAGASSSLTQFQGGWTQKAIRPMTFAAMSITPGDYVVGQLINFAQVNSNWLEIDIYGPQAQFPTQVLNGATVQTSTLSVMSSGGLSSASGFSASTVVNAMSSSGLTSFGSVHFISHTNVTGGKTLGASATNGALSGLSSAITITLVTGFTSGSYHTALVSGAAMSTGGMVTGSFFTSSAPVGAITSASMSVAATNVLAATTNNFGYMGTGSTTSGFPTAFIAGIMSTGAIPTAITLTSTAVTYSGTKAFIQPWFCLVGS